MNYSKLKVSELREIAESRGLRNLKGVKKDELVELLKKGKGYNKMDATVQSFFMNFAKIVLYVVLVVSIISVLGVPGYAALTFTPASYAPRAIAALPSIIIVF